ncbi:MAG: THUMP domain-containing protein [Planctomycetes bacterium]|nr:THUMP domain-containing protein [Planctomycetota bacterium]
MRHEYFIPCAPGVERTLFKEVKALKLPRAEQQVGGVRFVGETQHAWQANLELRTAVRVLQRLARFSCRTDDQLYTEARAIDWSPYLDPDGTFFVDAQVRDSTLTHSQFVAQRTKDAIADWFLKSTHRRPSVSKDDADLRVHVHLSADRATISVDTSGESLHKRGWRRYQGFAPLGECLAAAMTLEADWDRRAPIVDPFCGSGTLLIEAALLAADVAPGLFRKFGFERWPNHKADPYTKFFEQTAARMRWPSKLRLHARDFEAQHIEGLHSNFSALAELPASGAPTAEQLDRTLIAETGNALDFPWQEGWGALILSNLPYGIRIGDSAEVKDLHCEFGRALRMQCKGYSLALLLGDKQLAHSLGLKEWASRELRNGALRCQFVSTRLA